MYINFHTQKIRCLAPFEISTKLTRVLFGRVQRQSSLFPCFFLQSSSSSSSASFHLEILELKKSSIFFLKPQIPKIQKKTEMSKNEEPVVGVPYYIAQNPYQAGAIPPNAVFGDPKGVPIQQTIFRDTPAPFNCLYCGGSGLTTVRFSRFHLSLISFL